MINKKRFNKKADNKFLSSMNKKASVSATLTWMVASFIVVFILVIFLVAVVLIDFKKQGIRANVDKTEINQDLVYTQIALSYLNSEINGVSVRDLVREKDYERKDDELRDEVSKHTSDFFNDLDLVWGVHILELDVENPRPYILGPKLGCNLNERKVEVVAPFAETGKIIIRVFICEEAMAVDLPIHAHSKQ